MRNDNERKRTEMVSAVCTLFEGKYHLGLGALVNSLFHHGFRGVVWAGYRGELPPWATPIQERDGFKEFTVADNLSICFVPLHTRIHLTNYKPQFMLDLFEHYCPKAESLFYFDPDIVIKCRWTFFEEWVSYGIAVVQDVNHGLPINHPIRAEWKKHLAESGFPLSRELDRYFNAGFIGIRHEWMGSLHIWKDLLASIGQTIALDTFLPGDRSMPFYAPDQDTMNEMLMSTEAPLSTIGPEGMDFMPGGFTMSHATGDKPWRRRFIREALGGRAPRLADKLFWNHVQSPIRLYGPSEITWKKICIKGGSAIGRVIRRS